jgi:hypothetical protein
VNKLFNHTNSISKFKPRIFRRRTLEDQVEFWGWVVVGCMILAVAIGALTIGR